MLLINIFYSLRFNKLSLSKKSDEILSNKPYRDENIKTLILCLQINYGYITINKYQKSFKLPPTYDLIAI